MKNLLFWALAIFAVTTLTAKTRQRVPPGEFLISGELTGIPDSTVFILYKSDGNLLKRVGYDTLADGKFLFRDTVTTTQTRHLLGTNNGIPNHLLEIWVAPGSKVTVTGGDKLIGTWDIRSKIPQQIEENRYRDFTKDAANALMMQKAAEDEAGPAQRDSMRLVTKALQNELDAKTLLFMRSAPITPLWIEKLRHMTSFLQYGYSADSRDEMQSLYDRMPAAQQQSETGRLIHRYLHPEPTVGIGDAMADGDLYDLKGNLRRLAEFKGRYILLDFWSQGCGPCILSIPEMEQLAQEHKDRVAVVSICQDKKDLWKKYIAKKGMTGNQWNELVDEAPPLAAKYRIKGIPHYVLIDPDGRIVDVWSGYGEGYIRQKLNEHLK